MAKNRLIACRFWDDPFIADLSSGEKLLFIYLLTNSLTTIAGAYEISIEKILFDTKLERPAIVAALAKFEAAEKIYYRENWIFLRNFAKHQAESPKIQAGIKNELKRCPRWVCDMVSISYPYDTANLIKSNSIKSNSIKSDSRGAEPQTPEPGHIVWEFPIRELLEAFPGLSLAPAQIGAIEAEVTPEHKTAWIKTIEKYRLNYDPYLSRYDPSKIGNLLGVFRNFRAPTRRPDKNDQFNNGLSDLANDPDFGFVSEGKNE